ncbi:hypothetical protein KIN20_037381 [Parelaphostrongylus tenuis]|uniref:Uncharacterized protein n=1 Tax=Parelaphostrongylus tenuis TaxID=148309 RepID=A0AAD5RE69_PARTN|nr:hypothetical protein KIN20_037381 [Parelaphostrongylus tenuis]
MNLVFSFATEQRRRVAFAIFRQLALENSVHFGTNIRKHVYDNGNTFYSTGCTISDEESFEMRTVRIKNLKEDNDKGALREVCRFFEVLTSQWLYEQSVIINS